MKRTYLFGRVPFDTITKKVLVETLSDWAGKHKKSLVLNMNTHGAVIFLKNRKYAQAIKSADIIYPDGWGPVLASRFLSGPLKERVNVGDFIPDLLQLLNKNKLALYLLGCENATVKKAESTIREKYPDIVISGSHHGFFSRSEEKLVIKEIWTKRPDFVLVGIGVPNQELWIYKNWNILPNAIYMGVGGVFYYIAGIKSRAPKWIRNYYLEWLYRFFQEPKRLWKRYTLDNAAFMYLFVKSLFKLRFKRKLN